MPTAHQALTTTDLATDGILLAGEVAEGEDMNQVRACNDYLLMGPTRGYVPLARLYATEKLKRGRNVPTTSRGTLMRWAKQFDWPKRAAEFDLEQEQIRIAKEQQAINTGLARPAERVTVLKAMAEQVIQMLRDRGFLDERLRSVRDNSGYHIVKEERIDRSGIEAVRGLLDDLSKETGGRVKITQHLDPPLLERDGESEIRMF